MSEYKRILLVVLPIFAVLLISSILTPAVGTHAPPGGSVSPISKQGQATSVNSPVSQTTIGKTTPTTSLLTDASPSHLALVVPRDSNFTYQNSAGKPMARFSGDTLPTGAQGNDGYCFYGPLNSVNGGTCGPPSYQGGPVMKNVQIILDFWAGPSWSEASDCGASGGIYDNASIDTGGNDCAYMFLIQRFTTDLCNDSPLLNLINQYTDSKGNSLTSCTLFAPTNGAFNPVIDLASFPNTPLQDGDIQSEASSIASFEGASNNGVNTLVLVYTPATEGSCMKSNDCFPTGDFCAYHGNFGTGILGLGPTLEYANMPDVLATKDCGINKSFSPNRNPGTDAEISVTSHEQIEAFTDPKSDAWFCTSCQGNATGSEIGDLCAYDFTGTEAPIDKSNVHLGSPGLENPYRIQTYWSNSNGGCTLDTNGPPTKVTLTLWPDSLTGTDATVPPRGFPVNLQEAGETTPDTGMRHPGLPTTVTVFLTPGVANNLNVHQVLTANEEWCFYSSLSAACGGNITLTITTASSLRFVYYDLLAQDPYVHVLDGSSPTSMPTLYSAVPPSTAVSGEPDGPFLTEQTGLLTTPQRVFDVRGDSAGADSCVPATTVASGNVVYHTCVTSSGERWATNGSCPADGSPCTTPYVASSFDSITNIDYRHQYALSQVSYNIIGGGTPPNPPTLSYSSFGSSRTTPFNSITTSTRVWVDSDTILFASTLPTTNAEVWVTVTSCIVNLQGYCDFASAYGGSLASGSVSFTFYHQYEQTLTSCSRYTQVYDPAICTSYTVVGGGTPTGPIISYTSLGQAKTITLPCAPRTEYNYNTNPPTTIVFLSCNIWMDSGTTATVTNPITSSNPSEMWVTSTSSWTINGVNVVAQPIVYLHQAVTSTTTVGGAASTDQTSITGVSVAITGSSATDGTAVTVTSTLLNGQPSGTGQLSISGVGYVDVKITGITDGTARVCITNPNLTTPAAMQYWDGTNWVNAGNIIVTGDTVCGDIPVSALKGTPLVIGTIPLLSVTITSPIIQKTSSLSGVCQTTALFSSTPAGGLSPFTFSPANPVQVTLTHPGTQTVSITVTDYVGQTATGTSYLTLIDDTPPVLTPPAALTVPANGPGGYTGTIPAPVVTDNCPGTVTISNNSPVTLPIGTTTIVWTATDASGNAATTIGTVIVVPRTTSTSVSCSPNFVLPGHPTECQARVSDTTSGTTVAPTGMISWGASIAGSFSPNRCTLDASATCTVTFTPVSSAPAGNAQISASYPGDTDHSGSSGSTILAVAVPPKSAVTSTSLCSFDLDPQVYGQQLALVYLQNFTAPSTYILATSLPTQFDYNIFYHASPGTKVTLQIQVPYPFVTAGSGSVRLWGSVAFTSQGCFNPSKPIKGFTISPGQINLNSYATRAMGSYTTLTITGTVPSTGLVYVTVQLGYGLQSTGGYANSNNNAINNNHSENIAQLQSYTFSYSTVIGDVSQSDAQTVQSENIFVTCIPGFCGIVLNSQGQPVQGATVQIYTTTGSLLATATTNQYGLYYSSYTASSTATFTVQIPAYNLKQTVILPPGSFALAIFVIP